MALLPRGVGVVTPLPHYFQSLSQAACQGPAEESGVTVTAGI